MYLTLRKVWLFLSKVSFNLFDNGVMKNLWCHEALKQKKKKRNPQGTCIHGSRVLSQHHKLWKFILDRASRQVWFNLERVCLCGWWKRTLQASPNPSSANPNVQFLRQNQCRPNLPHIISRQLRILNLHGKRPLPSDLTGPKGRCLKVAHFVELPKFWAFFLLL